MIISFPYLAVAQPFLPDSSSIKASGINHLFLPVYSCIDTSLNHFQINDPNYQHTFSISSIGNFASPYISNIYFHQNKNAFHQTETKAFLIDYRKTHFYRTLVPFSILNMAIGPEKEVGISFLHTQNIDRFMNFSFQIDATNAPGQYVNQLQKFTVGNFTASYFRSRYFMLFAMNINKEKHLDPGGVISPNYIEDTLISPRQIGFKLSDANSRLNYNNWIFSTGINLLNDKARSDSNYMQGYFTVFTGASLSYYQFRYSDVNPQYTSYITNKVVPYYQNSFYTNKTKDELKYDVNKYHTGIKMNKIPGAGLPVSVYLKGSFWRESVFNDASSMRTVNYSMYSSVVETGFSIDSGPVTGNFNYAKGISGYQKNFTSVTGSIDFLHSSHIFGLRILASYEKQKDWFYDYYVSNHYQWINQFMPPEKTALAIEIPFFGKFLLKIHYAQLNHYIYINDTIPVQHDNTISIAGFSGKADVQFWKFRSATQFYFQHSTNKKIISQPLFSGVESLFFESVWFRNVMKTQIGFDVRYHTQFYSPRYIPALGMFVAQHLKQTGNYPVIDLFFNFQVTRARVFIKLEHANYGIFGNNNYSTYDYPLTGRVFRTGISWNFYD